MPESKRQLSAIMFTDIVGYTALMGKDSAKALELIRISKQIQKPLVEKYNGKWLKEMGDGAMAQFSTALDAVNCSIEIQESARAKLDAKLRIGIHLGDITIENDDIFGDGVNVASRLESIADPGGIYISDAIEKSIRGQLNLWAKYLGEVKLKNVDYGVRTYALQGTGLPVPDKIPSIGSKAYSINKSKFLVISSAVLIILLGLFYYFNFWERKPTSEPSAQNQNEEVKDKSIAVLPFVNMNNDPDQEYFSDGVTEDIIGQLAKISDLKVISRTSTMLYKNTNKNIRTIAEELGVSTILEGSVRQSGNKVRIAAQLIDAKTESLLWAQTFDMEMIEIFAIQSAVAKGIAKSLNAKLSPFESRRLDVASTKIPKVYDLYLKARFLENQYQKNSYYKAIELFEQAIEMDPDFAPAYAGIAKSYGALGSWIGELSAQVALEKINPYLRRALELDGNLAIAHSALAYKKFYFEWNFEEAEGEFLLSNGLDHSDMINWSGYHHFLNMMGRFEEASELWKKGNEIDPISIWNFAYMGATYFFLNRPQEAIDFCQTAVELIPYHPIVYDKLGWVYYNTGDYDKTIGILEKSINSFGIRPPSTLAYLSLALNKTGQKEKSSEILNELKKRNQNGEKGIAFYLAVAYAGIGESKLAFEWMGNAYEAREVDMIWLKVEPQFKGFHDDPRWQEMLDKVGFPD